MQCDQQCSAIQPSSEDDPVLRVRRPTKCIRDHEIATVVEALAHRQTEPQHRRHLDESNCSWSSTSKPATSFFFAATSAARSVFFDLLPPSKELTASECQWSDQGWIGKVLDHDPVHVQTDLQQTRRTLAHLKDLVHNLGTRTSTMCSAVRRQMQT